MVSNKIHIILNNISVAGFLLFLSGRKVIFIFFFCILVFSTLNSIAGVIENEKLVFKIFQICRTVKNTVFWENFYCSEVPSQ